MASLSEMVQAADYKQRGKLAADPLYSGVASFGQGVEKGFDTGKKGLETAIKLIELRSKLQELKLKAEQQKYVKTVLQAQGILPLDENEKDAARSAANKGVGTGDVNPADSIKTTQGKVTSIVDAASGGNVGNNAFKVDVDPVATLNSRKLKVKSTKDDRAKKSVELIQVRTLAKDMAKGAYAEQIQKQTGGNPSFFENEKIRTYVPTPADIEKFMPTARKYLGLEDDTQTIKEPASADVKKAQPNMPGPDLIGDLDDVDSLWALIKQ